MPDVVNLNRLTLGGRIVAIAGLLLFIDSLLPWFRACVDFGQFGGKVCGSHNGWNNVLSLIAILLAIALVVHVVLELSGTALPSVGTLSWGLIQLVVAGVAALFVVLQVIIGDHKVPRSIGAYLGIVFVAGLVYGAFLRFQDSQKAVPHGGPYQQGPPPGYPQGPPPGYQQGPPPGGYQQGPPPGYGQAPPPGYQQAPPPGYQQGPPPGYQQGPGI
ncbi:MAG TPA: hypothetical protein VMU51_38690 [Mycobacteriales bacterium]|nr:hypothetical protein [Mycobacteriales bacterium]